MMAGQRSGSRGKLRGGLISLPSFPSSVLERMSAKLCLASGSGLETEFRDVRSQTEFGNEEEEDSGWSSTSRLTRASRVSSRALICSFDRPCALADSRKAERGCKKRWELMRAVWRGPWRRKT